MSRHKRPLKMFYFLFIHTRIFKC